MDQAVTSPQAATSQVVELRQYTLKPGRRDELIEMFEKYFVAPQEAEGIRVHGEFRVASQPDRFAWLRGFTDMPQRARALGAFYGGPAWQAHRDAANDTMADSDDVLLLQPAEPGQGFTLARRMGAFMVATIFLLQTSVDAAFLRNFKERIAPAMAQAGGAPVATLKSLEEPNNFPRLPIREGEHAFVALSAFTNAHDLEAFVERLRSQPAWGLATVEVLPRLAKPVQQIILQPTQAAIDRSREPYRYSLDGRGDVRDFDFVQGRWRIVNHRLMKRGVGSDAWDTFPSTSWAKVLLGGVANVDEVEFPTKGWRGMTMRHFDLEKRQWAIYWINSRDGKLTSPVYGGFSGDTGLFYGDDEDEGRAVRVVYRWTRQGAERAGWEQAFSFDGGATWEANWVMELTRTGD